MGFTSLLSSPSGFDGKRHFSEINTHMNNYLGNLTKTWRQQYLEPLLIFSTTLKVWWLGWLFKFLCISYSTFPCSLCICILCTQVVFALSSYFTAWFSRNRDTVPAVLPGHVSKSCCNIRSTHQPLLRCSISNANQILVWKEPTATDQPSTSCIYNTVSNWIDNLMGPKRNMNRK